MNKKEKKLKFEAAKWIGNKGRYEEQIFIKQVVLSFRG